ncbi:MAG: GSU2403 family nucleotidyltransferase fold protein [Candidatus Omnitrophota bacterium]
MSDLEKLESGFQETLAVLKDVLPEIVVVGGWCPYLYARYLWKKPIPEIPTTTDIDLGVLETGTRRFKVTVYEKLKSAGYALERICEDEELPVEFIYQKKAVKLKVEFITSFETSDDTLNRFLGSELACNRIEAFELLLKQTVTVPIKVKNELLTVKVPTPEIFFYHKAITFVIRSEGFKRDKDLFYVYFILKFHPDKAALLAALAGFEKDEYFNAFRDNIREYLSSNASPGYLMLRPFLRGWIEEGSINEEIRNTFKEILKLF